MKRSTNHIDMCRHPGWRVFIIGLAVFGLALSVATRTFQMKVNRGVVVASAASQATRQHMDRDAVSWAPPDTVLTVLQVPTFYPFVAPAGPPLASVLFDESLSNRPPPSC